MPKVKLVNGWWVPAGPEPKREPPPSTAPQVPIKAINLKRYSQDVETWVIDCPFCDREHTHGAGSGNRAAHCLETRPGSGSYDLLEPDGTTQWLA